MFDVADHMTKPLSRYEMMMANDFDPGGGYLFSLSRPCALGIGIEQYGNGVEQRVLNNIGIEPRSCDGESDEESIPELVPAGEYDECERITAVEYSGLYAAFEASFDSLLAG